uniref:Uncharacterized protein n=1 Tax=Hippocampus comes TaxID=109280 RepID=A0A3Q2YK21_HIPCM
MLQSSCSSCKLPPPPANKKPSTRGDSQLCFICNRMCDLQFEDHVEHPVGAVGLQQFHNVRVFEHVADAGLPLQV